MRRMILSLLLFAGGCGSGGGDSNPLDGTVWALESTYCATGFKFAAREYEQLTICGLTGGGAGVEVAGGAYELTGDTMRLRLTRGSCNWAVSDAYVSWRINAGGTLTLQDDAGVAVFTRLTAGDGGQFAGTFGCFDDAGYFTPMPVRDL